MKPNGYIAARDRPARRAFLETTLALGAGTLIAPSLDAQGSSPATRADVKPPLPAVLPELPARVFVDHDGSRLERADRVGRRFTTARAAVAFDIDGEQIRAIYLIANPEKLAQLSGGARSKVNPSFEQN